MGIRSFMEIKAWQVARLLVQRIYRSTSQWPYRYRALADQINRSSVSVMANIAEGFDSASDSDFIRYLVYSRQSTSEVQSHLVVAKDQSLMGEEEFTSLFRDTDQVKAMVISFIQYLKKNPKH